MQGPEASWHIRRAVKISVWVGHRGRAGWNESHCESKILRSLVSCGWVVVKARRRRSRSGGETAEIRSELEPFEFYICVQCTHIPEAPALLGWRPSHLPAPCWPGTLQSRAVLSLGPLHLLWYWLHFSHLLSVPELPDCATLEAP